MPHLTNGLPRAILFDMDGTLTEPLLDFPRIKAEMGIGDRPILEALAEMDESARKTAEAVLHRHEDKAAAYSTLNAGCVELLAKLSQMEICSALITRNSRSSVVTVLKRHQLPIEVLVTREDAPPKPSPEPLWLACRKLEVDPQSAWMVGDGEYDIEAAEAAGILSVWLSHGRDRHFTARPWRQIRDLPELSRLIAGHTME